MQSRKLANEALTLTERLAADLHDPRLPQALSAQRVRQPLGRELVELLRNLRACQIVLARRGAAGQSFSSIRIS